MRRDYPLLSALLLILLLTEMGSFAVRDDRPAWKPPLAYAATCGDWMCELPTENYYNCYTDCYAYYYCGDYSCDAYYGEDEVTCPEDCAAGSSESSSSADPCGDLYCDPGTEDCNTCPTDCGACSSSESSSSADPCGDLYCDPGTEDCNTCPADCGTCASSESSGSSTAKNNNYFFFLLMKDGPCSDTSTNTSALCVHSADLAYAHSPY